MAKKEYIVPTTEVIFQMDEICQYGSKQTGTDEWAANEFVFEEDEQDPWDDLSGWYKLV